MKKDQKTPLKVTIEWKLLERIAEYYEFPSTVFVGNVEVFEHKTRNEAIFKMAKKYEKIRDLVMRDD